MLRPHQGSIPMRRRPLCLVTHAPPGTGRGFSCSGERHESKGKLKWKIRCPAGNAALPGLNTNVGEGTQRTAASFFVFCLFSCLVVLTGGGGGCLTQPRLASNLLCSSGCPWAPESSAFSVRLLGLTAGVFITEPNVRDYLRFPPREKWVGTEEIQIFLFMKVLI